MIPSFSIPGPHTDYEMEIIESGYANYTKNINNFAGGSTTKKVVSVSVAGLKTTARYVDHLVVEVYSDSGLTNLVGRKTSPVSWDGTYNNQKSSILFNGLVYGTAYWMRAGVVAPVSGDITWSATYNFSAGTANPPACTYGGTFTETVGGASFIVTPANVPANIDHYEIIWTLDGSTPNASAIPYLGHVVPSYGGNLQFSVGLKIGDTATVFIRAVNQSADSQAWQSLGSYSPVTTWGGDVTGTINGTSSSAVVLGSVTGTQRNLVPDSDLKFGTTYAVPSGTSWPIVNGGGLNGGNAFSITGTGVQIAAQRNIWTLPFVIGQTYTLSGNCRNSGALSGTGTPRFLVYRNNVEVANISAPLTGGSGRYSTSYTVPSGTTSLQLMAFSDSPTVPNGVIVSLDSPQWEVGNVMTKYVPNALDDATGGLASGIPVQEPGGALSPVALGDQHKRSRTALDVNGYLVTGTPTTPTASLDTGASRANTAIDSGNVVVPAGIDFARGYTNKHLGNIPDDPASGRLARRSAYIAPGGSATWVLLGTWTFPADGGGYTLRVEGLGGQGFNSLNNQQAKIDIIIRSGDGGIDNLAPNISGATWIGHGNSAFVSSVKVASHGGSTAPTQNQWDIYVDVNAWSSAHWDFYCDSKSSFATSGTNTTDPGPASSTIVVAAGQYVHDTSSNLYGTLLINGSTKTAKPLQDIHDRVVSTISGYTGSGLANVPDDATSSRYAVLAIDANRRPIIDGGSAHVNWTQDHLPDGTDYARTRAGALFSGVPRSGASSNAIANPGFESNIVGTPLGTAVAIGANIGDHWTLASGASGTATVAFSLDNTGGYSRSGSQCLRVSPQPNASIGNSGAFIGGKVFATAFPVTQNDRIAVNGYYRIDSNVALPSNIRGEVRIGVEWIGTSSEQYSWIDYPGAGAEISTGGYVATPLGGVWQAPAGATQCQVACQVFLYSQGTGVSMPNGLAFDVRFDDLIAVRQAGYGSEIWDDGANGFYRLAGVASDNTGLTLGYSGYPQLVIGQRTITLPTGGTSAYQIKKVLSTSSTGLQANGTFINFSSLTDQAGNALPTFDAPPLVALAPYNMSTPPVMLYASGMSTTGFTLNSYSAGTPGTSSGISLSGTDTLFSVPGGGVANSVQFRCSIKSAGFGGSTASATFDCYINDTMVGTVYVSGPNNGNSYQVSQSFNTSGSPTSVNLKYTVPTNSGVPSTSCTAYVSYTSGTTPVSANVTCQIMEQWN